MEPGKEPNISAEQVAKAQAAQAEQGAKTTPGAQPASGAQPAPGAPAAPGPEANILAAQAAKKKEREEEKRAFEDRVLAAGTAGAWDPELQYSKWEQAPFHNPYLPEWTDPEWGPATEYSATGKMQRTVFWGAGRLMRPEILPGDARWNPTEFARRFGTYPTDGPREKPPVRRSFMSPRMVPREPVEDPGSFESMWTEAESWQSYVHSGPTTQEIIAAGVYVPNHRFSGPAIEGDLHPFLARDKWVNGGIDRRFIPYIRWKFGDQEGMYDANDDRVWAAIQPALRLAGRVLSSNHPYWNAILSLYNVRPVPADVDGRTEAVKKEAGAPLPALWLDENKPGMYPAAAELRQLGFRSRDTTLAMLSQYLRFTIGTWDRPDVTSQSWGVTIRPTLPADEEPRIFITIDPSALWPLVCSDFPEVQTAVTFDLANIILHEMAHACRMAHELLLQKTSLTMKTLKGVSNLGITADMIARFGPLGVQIWGTGELKEGYFFEEGPQSEEGKSFEKQLWGDTIFLGPPFKSRDVTVLRAYLSAAGWPWAHTAPDLQHAEVDRSFYGPYARDIYKGYLLNPPAPVYNSQRPIEVEDYERFLQESWWKDQFQRFGHQALRLNPPPNALMLMSTYEGRFMRAELKQELSEEDYNFVQTVAYPRLLSLKQQVLAVWLLQETEELVIGNATAARFKFEARTWRQTYERINTQLDKSLTDIGELGSAIDGWIADGMAGRLAADAQATITASFDRAATTIVTDDLMVVERHLRYSVQYAQALIGMYSLLPREKDRRTVHQHYMTPLRNHLNSVRDKLGTLAQGLQGFAAIVSRFTEQNFLVTLLQGFQVYIVDFLQTAYVTNAGLEHVIGLLADELVAPAFDYTRHPGTLPAVPEARKRMSMAAALKKAAARPLRRLMSAERNTTTDIVQRWASIIEVARQKRLDLDLEADAAMEVDD